MARTNFQYEKLQREREKKRKAEEKARRKQEAKQGQSSPEQPAEGQDVAGELQGQAEQDPA